MIIKDLTLKISLLFCFLSVPVMADYDVKLISPMHPRTKNSLEGTELGNRIDAKDIITETLLELKEKIHK